MVWLLSRSLLFWCIFLSSDAWRFFPALDLEDSLSYYTIIQSSISFLTLFLRTMTLSKLVVRWSFPYSTSTSFVWFPINRINTNEFSFWLLSLSMKFHRDEVFPMHSSDAVCFVGEGQTRNKREGHKKAGPKSIIPTNTGGKEQKLSGKQQIICVESTSLFLQISCSDCIQFFLLFLLVHFLRHFRSTKVINHKVPKWSGKKIRI